MKTAEEMVKAIRDWVNRLIKKSGEEMGKQIETLVKEVDPDTILRKTGDASKVITTFPCIDQWYFRRVGKVLILQSEK